jgi:hypothetical protein
MRVHTAPGIPRNVAAAVPHAGGKKGHVSE